MSKNLQYVKVFEVLKNAKGPVSSADVKAISGIVPTRLSTYLWEIKKNTGYAVKSNREGRSVVSYELVGSGTAPALKPEKPEKKEKTVVAEKKEKKPRAEVAPPTEKPKREKKAKVVVPEVNEIEENDPIVEPAVASEPKIVNVLDEIYSDVVDYEDRSYAESYVNGIA